MPSVTEPLDLRYGSKYAVFVRTERRMHLEGAAGSGNRRRACQLA
jgi:hypothetical protein